MFSWARIAWKLLERYWGRCSQHHRTQCGAVRLAIGLPLTPANPFGAGRMRTAEGEVESRMGAVAWGLWPTLRFPSPLIEPDVPISGIRLSDWFHRKARAGAVRGRRSRRSKPSFP